MDQGNNQYFQQKQLEQDVIEYILDTVQPVIDHMG